MKNLSLFAFPLSLIFTLYPSVSLPFLAFFFSFFFSIGQFSILINAGRKEDKKKKEEENKRRERKSVCQQVALVVSRLISAVSLLCACVCVCSGALATTIMQELLAVFTRE